MGYFMRFFLTDATPVTLADLTAGLNAIDSAFTLIPDPELADFGVMSYAGEMLAEVEINHAGEDILEEDRDELRDLLKFSQHANRERVLGVIDAVQSAVILEAFWKEWDSEPVLEKTDLLFDWLFDHHTGLLLMDGEGFFDKETLILPMKTRI